jgi:hypothetical protein
VCGPDVLFGWKRSHRKPDSCVTVPCIRHRDFTLPQSPSRCYGPASPSTASRQLHLQPAAGGTASAESAAFDRSYAFAPSYRALPHLTTPRSPPTTPGGNGPLSQAACCARMALRLTSSAAYDEAPRRRLTPKRLAPSSASAQSGKGAAAVPELPPLESEVLTGGQGLAGFTVTPAADLVKEIRRLTAILTQRQQRKPAPPRRLPPTPLAPTNPSSAVPSPPLNRAPQATQTFAQISPQAPPDRPLNEPDRAQEKSPCFLSYYRDGLPQEVDEC